MIAEGKEREGRGGKTKGKGGREDIIPKEAAFQNFSNLNSSQIKE